MRNGPPPDPASAAEVDDLRARLAEAEETLRAIGSGEADALVIAGSQGDEVTFLGDGQTIFRQLIEAVGQGTATLSADGVVLGCDADLARTLGRQVDELVGTSMAAYLSPEDYTALGDALALPEATPRRRRVRLIAGNGDLVPVYLSISILHGSEEQRVSCLVFTDLEKVFSAEQGLRESAKHYRELVEFAPVGIGVIADGKIALVNAAALRLLGADSAEQLIGRPAADITHPDSLEDVQSRIRRMVSGEQGLFPAHAVCLRLDGTRMDVEITASPVSLEGVAAIQVVFVDVTERKQAEQRLQYIMKAVESAGNAIGISDAQGHHFFQNPATSALFGYETAEEMEAAGGGRVVVKDPEVANELYETIESGNPWAGELGMVTKSGRVFPAYERADAIMDPEGRLIGLIGIVTDITERKQAEEAARRQAEVLQAVFDNVPLMIAFFDASGSVQYVNRGWEQTLGWSLEETRRRDFLVECYPEEEERARVAALMAEASGAWSDCHTHLGGRVLETAWANVRLSDGRTIAIGMDITERKRAEEALRGSEARYRGYVDTAPYGVFVSDEKGRYLEVNQAAADLTGYAQEELVQLGIADVVAPQSRDWGRRHFARLLRTGHSSGDGVFLRKDGTTFHGRVDAVRLAATRYLGFIVDISEQKRAAAEIEASVAQVKQALTATVAALGATTELRDPYTAGHQRRVAELAGAIAAGLGWDAARIEMVETAGLLHDVGKIIVPAEILARPGRLSEMEMELIRGHAAASAALIAGIEFGGPVTAIVNQHHERLDGSGYPQGLTGENILPEARILAVADVVEAMSSHRPYRPALGMEVALAEVREHAGEKYDAEIVTVCGRLVEEQGFQFTP
jgi:PAS domain S-box-containing protein/putative nucleotidyltransferase with HDIG domain